MPGVAAFRRWLRNGLDVDYAAGIVGLPLPVKDGAGARARCGPSPGCRYYPSACLDPYGLFLWWRRHERQLEPSVFGLTPVLFCLLTCLVTFD